MKQSKVSETKQTVTSEVEVSAKQTITGDVKLADVIETKVVEENSDDSFPLTKQISIIYTYLVRKFSRFSWFATYYSVSAFW